jgi:hypothetical protein
MIYLSGGRIVTLRGERGLVSVPQQAIESGTLEGDVVIRLFVPKDGQPLKVEDADPEVIIRTAEASFDNVLGEIRCNKSIRIDAENVSFSGMGLTMLLGDGERMIERLVIERASEPIRVVRGATKAEASAVEPGVTTDPVDAPSDTANASEAVTRFYTLQLEHDVRIEQFTSADADEPESVISGDRLHAVFSLEGDGLQATQSPTQQAGLGFSSHPMGRDGLLVGATLAALSDEATVQPKDPIDSELTLIHYTGRMIMKPATESEGLAGPDDIRIEIDGGPDGQVQVHDARSEAVVSCSLLRYRSARDLVELESLGGPPLEVTSPRLGLRGERFWFSRPDGTGRLEGAGSMELESELEIDWADGVDLRFRPDSEKLERAVFDGMVRVDNAEFELVADSLDVLFAATDPDEPDTIRQIIAKGSEEAPAAASRKSELGMLSAETIDLALARDDQGRTVPTTLRADGAVRAQDAEQTLWTDRLDVDFASAPSASDQRGVSTDLGTVELERVVAEDGVHVQLADGARVWAQSLEGSGTQRKLALKSNDGSLLIVRGNVVADQIHELRFDEARRNAVARGPGRFRYFDLPIAMPASGPTDPPLIDESSLSMEATWGERMDFDDQANDGAGAIELLGDVIVRNRPEPREANDLDADRLRIDFARRTDRPLIGKDGNPPSEDQLAAFSGSRSMRVLTAVGDSRLESRTWKTAERTGDPGLFRITGPRIRYDADSGEGDVQGAGQLLVNQLEPDSAEPSEPVAVGVSIGGDGTTRFTWDKDMQMRHQVADRYLVTMVDGVEILHAGLRADDTLTLTADSLAVLLDRPSSPSDGAAAPASGVRSSDALDLGGQARILRVTAEGRVFVRTPEQDVECEVFDYDTGNQIARLTAREGRLVRVLTRGAASPVRAESVTWDMKTGRIQITGAVGSAGR